ncbi:MAG: DUF2971 domain-containing protein [Rhizobium sp.]|nr:DUF2971 domain-containing protein [Rhizobium sp.]
MPHPGSRPFYKYVAPQTALAILQNQSVRFSSPLLFNDPFDHQTCLHLDFDLQQFPAKLLDRIEHLVRNPQIPIRQDVGPIQLVLEIMRAKFSTHGFPRDAFVREALPVLADGSNAIETTRLGFEVHWQESLKASRTFCVTEENDSLLMWAHYARDHTGAVLELWSLPEEDNALSVSEAVEYSDTPPAFFTEEAFLDLFTGVGQLDVKALTRRSVYTKSNHWAYEKEWRVYYPLSDKPGLFEYTNLRESEFKAIYFGCRAEPAFIASARALIAQHYPGAAQWVAERRKDAYAVTFREI